MRTRSEEERANLALVEKVYKFVLDPLDSSRVDDFFTPGYIQHSPLAATGAQGLKDFLDWARGTSPDARHYVKRMLVDGDYVVAHVHVIIKPGERGNVVIDIFRIENGRVAEHWDASQPIAEKPGNDNGAF